MTAIKEDNRRLAQTVSELRAERRAQERRLRDLQRQLDLARAQLVMGNAEGGAVPELRVEVAAPGTAPEPATASPPAPPAPAGAARVVGVADDGAEIVYEGDAATGKQATLDDEPRPAPRSRPRAGRSSTESSRAGRSSAESAPAGRSSAESPPVGRSSAESAPAAKPAAEPSKAAKPAAEPARTAAGRASRVARPQTREREREREPAGDRGAAAGNAYRAAVELVKSGDHAAGAAALRAFLSKHPRHAFADNAQYWLGEAHYAQKDYQSALTEFRTVIETYPRGNKVPDALLKVGYCYLALGQTERSRAVLEQVVNLYPKTEPAATAAKRLESL
jgi:tol-pal system protein YbgF